MSKYSPKPHYPLPDQYKTYFGGKSAEGTYQTIINQMRPHSVYVEPFLGSGAIFRRKRAARYSLLGDLDRRLLLAHGTSLSLVTANAKASQESVAQATGYFTGHFNCDIEWHWPTLENPHVKPTRVRFMNEGWQRTLAYVDRTLVPPYPANSVCTYLDPPYLKSSRKTQRDIYEYEMTDEEHVALLDHALTMKGDVLISTYPNDLYALKLRKWRLVEFTNQTRQGRADEWLFCNFPEPTILHDPQYYGKDYRERQNVKDLTDSWINQLLRKPKPVQHMMLEHLTAAVERGELRKKPKVDPLPEPEPVTAGTRPLPADAAVLAMAFDEEVDPSTAAALLLDELTPADELEAGDTAFGAEFSPVPTVEPVEARAFRPAPPVGKVWVDHRCPVCDKQKETMKKADAAKLTQYGYYLITDTTWGDSEWLCSMVCTENAAAHA